MFDMASNGSLEESRCLMQTHHIPRALPEKTALKLYDFIESFLHRRLHLLILNHFRYDRVVLIGHFLGGPIRFTRVAIRMERASCLL
jgi:hypothetical protein